MADRKTDPRPSPTKRRVRLPDKAATAILEQSLRRCCRGYMLRGDRNERKGQIAHINHDPSDNRRENLVYLCLDHHDEYDRPTRLSKGLTSGEVLAHRTRLYEIVARGEILGNPHADREAVAAIPDGAGHTSRQRQ